MSINMTLFHLFEYRFISSLTHMTWQGDNWSLSKTPQILHKKREKNNPEHTKYDKFRNKKCTHPLVQCTVHTVYEIEMLQNITIFSWYVSYNILLSVLSMGKFQESINCIYSICIAWDFFSPESNIFASWQYLVKIRFLLNN